MTGTALPTPRRAVLDLPPHAPRDLRLLILLADTPLPACVPHKSLYRSWQEELTRARDARRVVKRSGDYHDIFTTLLRSSIDVARAEVGANGTANGSEEARKLTVESYDVVRGVYPGEDEVKRADGLLITGSGAVLSLPEALKAERTVADTRSRSRSRVQRRQRTSPSRG